MTLDEARKHYPPIYTIYDHPTDYPDAYVVRVWFGEVPGEMTECQSLRLARKVCWDRGANTILPRDAEDDPKIIESWI